MAFAKKTEAKYSIDLLLSQDEAETLLLVVGRIGGSQHHSRRGYTNKVYHALLEAGVEETIWRCDTILHFKNEDGIDL